MMAYVVPVLVALFVWWFSTGLVLLLDGLPQQVRYRSLMGATVFAGAALIVLAVTASQPTVGAAYLAFVAAIAVWGWHELAFLLGVVTGPRRVSCPPDTGVGRRFVLATQTLVYHEIAIALTLGAIAIITWDAPNQVGLWTFLVLFAMRLSAKLNIFLGVPNVTEEFLPDHMRFLTSYFARRSMNGLFPISVTLATLVGAYVFHAAFVAGAGPFQVAAYMLTGTLLLLGTLEHWLLVLPLPDAALWRWALNKPAKKPAAAYPQAVVPAAVHKDKTGPLAAVRK